MKMRGKQDYRVYVELFSNRPNFVVVGNNNRVISATWYKKMRHRDVLPGKEFELPPIRGKSILDMNNDEIFNILSTSDVANEEIVRILAQKAGGGGELMEELLARAEIKKNTVIAEISKKDIENIVKSINDVKSDLEELTPLVLLDSSRKPYTYHPIKFYSVQGISVKFENFSSAIDSYYTDTGPKTSIIVTQQDKRKKKVNKVLKAQKNAINDFERKTTRFKMIGDLIYQHFDPIDELLSTVMQARKKNVSWEEIQTKLAKAKENGIPSAQLLEDIKPKRALISLKIDSETIDVDFRKTTTEIANEFYQLAKKASRKIAPAKEALQKTETKLEILDLEITEQKIADSIMLKRRKRKWFEKYHWTETRNRYLVIGGKDIASNEEIVKKRMSSKDLFFHAELHGAPYTILVTDSSDKSLSEEDYNTAALLAASFSSGWKAGYGAVDIYYVNAENVSFSAPSGEYIPKGGIMVRGNRTYLRGVELSLAIGVQINEFNANVIYGSERVIRSRSKITVIIKPGSISKGKIAKQLKKIFSEKVDTSEDKAKIQGIDLNEFVHAVPHDSVIADVKNGILEDN
jgi:predicted ribosome quality control (RQC) complex YloA/Tae2 family protein